MVVHSSTLLVDPDALGKKSNEFQKILEVSKEERDRVQRMQLIDRAAAAIAAARALLKDTNLQKEEGEGEGGSGIDNLKSENKYLIWGIIKKMLKSNVAAAVWNVLKKDVSRTVSLWTVVGIYNWNKTRMFCNKTSKSLENLETTNVVVMTEIKKLNNLVKQIGKSSD